MICNSQLTIYHQGFDEETHNEIWTRFNYENAWIFNGENANANKGYDEANNIEVRLPLLKNKVVNINNFAIGDIIVEGNIQEDITTERDLQNYLIYKITSIKNNNFGINQHIHLSGK